MICAKKLSTMHIFNVKFINKIIFNDSPLLKIFKGGSIETYFIIFVKYASKCE